MADDNFGPAWDFLQKASEFTDLEEFQNAFAKAVAAFGFNQFSCTLITHPNSLLPLPRVLFGRSNKAWDDYYFEQGYLKVDPCVRLLFTSPGPFTWSDMPPGQMTKEARQILADAASADSREGFVIPVYGGEGDFYGVRLISPEREFDQSARPTLHALAAVYAFQGMKLFELHDDAPTNTPLTKRETICLYWAAEGKSDWDIGEILKISEATVHTHVENAKRKIGVRSRVQAAVIATVRGWLNVNSPN